MHLMHLPAALQGFFVKALLSALSSLCFILQRVDPECFQQGLGKHPRYSKHWVPMSFPQCFTVAGLKLCNPEVEGRLLLVPGQQGGGHRATKMHRGHCNRMGAQR